MAKLSRRTCRLNMKMRILRRVSVLRRCLYSFWNRVLACWIGKSVKYSELGRSSILSAAPPPVGDVEKGDLPSLNMADACCTERCDHDKDSSSDLVSLKITVLGDSHIGKTSFLTKYVGREIAQGEFATKGLNQINKTLCVSGARISYSMWEVAGDDSSVDHNIPAACKDSVAILFMFDLTSRCTLNSVIRWYKQARKWNQTAIPVLVGTKFDDFVQLPIDLQWTIASQARAYAKAFNATLFFSSATYNINVNKIFKFVTAQVFNLPWTLERNLTIGEPIIDF